MRQARKRREATGPCPIRRLLTPSDSNVGTKYRRLETQVHPKPYQRHRNLVLRTGPPVSKASGIPKSRLLPMLQFQSIQRLRLRRERERDPDEARAWFEAGTEGEIQTGLVYRERSESRSGGSMIESWSGRGVDAESRDVSRVLNGLGLRALEDVAAMLKGLLFVLDLSCRRGGANDRAPNIGTENEVALLTRLVGAVLGTKAALVTTPVSELEAEPKGLLLDVVLNGLGLHQLELWVRADESEDDVGATPRGLVFELFFKGVVACTLVGRKNEVALLGRQIGGVLGKVSLPIGVLEKRWGVGREVRATEGEQLEDKERIGCSRWMRSWDEERRRALSGTHGRIGRIWWARQWRAMLLSVGCLVVEKTDFLVVLACQKTPASQREVRTSNDWPREPARKATGRDMRVSLPNGGTGEQSMMMVQSKKGMTRDFHVMRSSKIDKLIRLSRQEGKLHPSAAPQLKANTAYAKILPVLVKRTNRADFAVTLLFSLFSTIGRGLWTSSG
ncbi:hypothetical protein FB45DRAFT_868176 [Roridomyces roridus]|uniref:Uncharacterized protein n=1 Tax=Roridomyces roridus TaxID=1738132 RepID=A0AAD7BPB9_9AGAR|nr:hypothetical protein FB45DRAFT_868176 [Roridomyces roridus]